MLLEAFHNGALSWGACIPAELETSNVVSGLALRLAGLLEGLEERKLLRACLPERDGVDGLEMGWVRQERDA